MIEHPRRPRRPFKRPPERVSATEEVGYSGEGSYAARKSLAESLLEIAAEERAKATARQKRLRIKEPLRTYFRRDPVLDPALKKLWAAGDFGRQLYVQIGKGLAALDARRLFELVDNPPATIEELAKAEILNSRFHND